MIGSGLARSIPLSVKAAPTLLDLDQPRRLKLPLGLGLGGRDSSKIGRNVAA
ncbi:MAG: hypothetical protein QY310_07370 [Candidatus Jettenia sp. CY-1]|nr:MAG: hypothetical protein QY310_07370 [Candidatus Jettenia sp. CY-1]